MEISVIVNEVCNYFHITPEDIRQKTRKREIVEARQVAMYFLKEYTKLTLSSIGDAFEKDHATVLHALNVVKALIETNCWMETRDMRYRKCIDELRSIITGIYEATPTEIMLQVRLSMSQYRNGRFVYTVSGIKKVSRLRTLFIPVDSVSTAMNMMDLKEVDSINLYVNYRKKEELKPEIIEVSVV